MGIDIMLAVFYFILFILSLAFNSLMFAVAYTGAFTAMFIVSAVLTGQIRHLLHGASEARARERAQFKPSRIITERMSSVDRLEPGQVAVGVKPEAEQTKDASDFNV